jgi:thymidine phosphorylase
MNHQTHLLHYKQLGIDTNQELIVYMPRNCDVCRAEGFQALTRLNVSANGKTIVANLNVSDNGLLREGEIGLSFSAAEKLGINQGDVLSVSHVQPLHSMSFVRAKIFGNELTRQACNEIIRDITEEKYSNIFLASFVTACSGNNMNVQEMCFLTEAMIASGNKLSWGKEIVADKHCIGGLPGNRTTLIVVPIVAALGICIPKVSSRAITSPAGTADTMEALTNVNLSVDQMRKVVEKENGCIAWGGAVNLSPADDIIIRVERALDIDSEGQMIASILSKKAAAGSTHCVIDIPVGPTAKVRTLQDAERLKRNLLTVGKYAGLQLRIIVSDGSTPVGFGIGPSLEARDVLAVLQNKASASKELRSRAIVIAAEIIQVALNKDAATAIALAEATITNGKAFEKLVAICNAQGYFTEPKTASFQKTITAPFTGTISEINNREIARVAKLAGAPLALEAGVDLHTQLNQQVEKGQPIFSIHANSEGELEYAYEYFKSNNVITIKPA